MTPYYLKKQEANFCENILINQLNLRLVDGFLFSNWKSQAELYQLVAINHFHCREFTDDLDRQSLAPCSAPHYPKAFIEWYVTRVQG